MKKEKTSEGDVVLIYYQDKPAMYARIEAIKPDMKKGWFLVTLLLFSLPAQTVTWILREEYIQGEPYTMGGQAIRLEKIMRIQTESTLQDASPEKKKPGKTMLRVISFKKPSLKKPTP